jgi:hypothetical protein
MRHVVSWMTARPFFSPPFPFSSLSSSHSHSSPVLFVLPLVNPRNPSSRTAAVRIQRPEQEVQMTGDDNDAGQVKSIFSAVPLLSFSSPFSRPSKSIKSAVRIQHRLHLASSHQFHLPPMSHLPSIQPMSLHPPSNAFSISSNIQATENSKPQHLTCCTAAVQHRHSTRASSTSTQRRSGAGTIFTTEVSHDSH